MGHDWDVVEDAELKTKVTELAERLAKQPTFGLSLIKKPFINQATTPLMSKCC